MKSCEPSSSYHNDRDIRSEDDRNYVAPAEQSHFRSDATSLQGSDLSTLTPSDASRNRTVYSRSSIDDIRDELRALKKTVEMMAQSQGIRTMDDENEADNVEQRATFATQHIPLHSHWRQSAVIPKPKGNANRNLTASTVKAYLGLSEQHWRTIRVITSHELV